MRVYKIGPSKGRRRVGSYWHNWPTTLRGVIAQGILLLCATAGVVGVISFLANLQLRSRTNVRIAYLLEFSFVIGLVATVVIGTAVLIVRSVHKSRELRREMSEWKADHRTR